MTNPVQPETQEPRFGLPVWTRRQWLEALVLIGLAPLTVISALIIAGFGNRVVDLLAQFAAPVLLTTILMTAGLGLLRMKAPAGLGVLTCLLLAFAVWPQWFPKASVPDPDAAILRVYSANLFYLNNDTARIRRSIEAADADIVVLIELASDPALRIDELLEGDAKFFVVLEVPRNGELAADLDSTGLSVTRLGGGEVRQRANNQSQP